MIGVEEKEVMILWLTLFRVQEREPKLVLSKRRRINAFSRKTLEKPGV